MNSEQQQVQQKGKCSFRGDEGEAVAFVDDCIRVLRLSFSVLSLSSCSSCVILLLDTGIFFLVAKVKIKK